MRYLSKNYHAFASLFDILFFSSPMGWDNESKIAILDEHIKTFNSQDGLQDHIIKLQTKKVGIILEIKVFLALELY